MKKISVINPSARDALNRYRLENSATQAANLRQIGSIDDSRGRSGGATAQMVKRIISAYENGLQ